MANLFGTGINQIPTNGMLGNLAFQDKAYVGVDAIGIGTTFVDSGTVGQVLQVTGGAYVSGNLGVGTTSPARPLHVNGTVRIADSAALEWGGTSAYIAGTSASNALLFNTSSVERVRIDSSGSVGIGTNNPSNRLTVYGTQSDTTPILSLLSGNTAAGFTNGAQIAFGYDGNTNYQHFIQTRHNSGNSSNAIDFYVSDGTQNNTLTSGSLHTMSLVSGSVGIGTTNPTSTLQVSGTFYNSGIGTFANGNTTYGTTSASSLELGLNNNSNAGTLKLWGTTTNAYGLIQATTNNLHIDCVVGATYLHYYDGDFVSFGTGAGAESARFTGSTGTLTLGTITPTGTTSQPLQVNGGAYFAGVGFATGSIGVGITNPQGTIDIRTSPQWNSFNWGANLVIGGARNNGLVVLDSGNTNPWGISNGSGNLNFGYGPALGDTTNPVTTILTLHKSSSSVLIGSVTPTGTTSQALQVNSGAYVSGNLGVGATNPASKMDVWSTTSGSTAIRATSSPSYSTSLYPGVISGLSTNAASGYAAQFAAAGIGVTSGELGVYSFFPTFANLPADRGPRRAVDLVGGFATSAWGTEYFAINVGRDGTANDASILTNERLRVDGSGDVGIGTTNPTYKLHTVGNIKATTSLHFGTGGTYEAGTIYSDANWGAIIRANTTSPTVADFLFTNSADTQRLRIDTSGNVIIPGNNTATGTASQPLQVTGGAYVSGSVGIGTTNPQSTLDVRGNINVTGIITTTGSGGVGIGSFLRLKPHLNEGGEIAFDYASGISGYYLDVSAGNVFRLSNYDANGTYTFVTNSTEKVRISNVGNLGIGTNNPTSKLDVIGDVKVLGVSTFTNANNAAIQIRSGASGSYANFNIGRTTNEVSISVAGSAGEFANNASAGDAVIRTDSTGKLLFTNGASNSTLAVAGNTVLVGTVSSTGTASQPLQVTGGAYVSGSVGIGTTNPQYKLHVVGSFGATTKSFIIDHPTQEGKKLQYACLEGPENSVYVRGKSQGSTIELPEYWVNLVDENSITVNLTPIGESATPRVNRVINNTVEIFSKEEGELDYYYIVFAERKDVAKLEVEF